MRSDGRCERCCSRPRAHWLNSRRFNVHVTLAGSSSYDRGTRDGAKPMTRVFLVLAVLVMPAGCAPQAAVSVGGASRGRERVERGLLPLVVVAGVPDSAFPLQHRMERYRVPGVSLTVIDEGRIAGSGAYGVRAAGPPGAVPG